MPKRGRGGNQAGRPQNPEGRQRYERPEKKPPRWPWLIPAIVIVAALIVVIGVIVAVSDGIRLF